MVYSASASLDTSMGLAQSSWVTGKGLGNGFCGEVPENSNLTLTCLDVGGKIGSKVFTKVDFASFGTPTGSCQDGFVANPACNAPKSVNVVQDACVNKSTCTVPATNQAFGGDPCHGHTKTLAVQLSGTCGQKQYELTTTVPVGGVAQVTVPVPGTHEDAAVTITEGTQTVWANGAFVPGVSGVRAGKKTSTGYTFDVGSGTFHFTALV